MTSFQRTWTFSAGDNTYFQFVNNIRKRIVLRNSLLQWINRYGIIFLEKFETISFFVGIAYKIPFINPQKIISMDQSEISFSLGLAYFFFKWMLEFEMKSTKHINVIWAQIECIQLRKFPNLFFHFFLPKHVQQTQSKHWAKLTIRNAQTTEAFVQLHRRMINDIGKTTTYNEIKFTRLRIWFVYKYCSNLFFYDYVK